MDTKKGFPTTIMRQLLLFYAYMSLLFLAPSVFAYSQHADAKYYFGKFVEPGTSVTDDYIGFNTRLMKKDYASGLELGGGFRYNDSSSGSPELQFVAINGAHISKKRVQTADLRDCKSYATEKNGSVIYLDQDNQTKHPYPKSYCVTVKKGSRQHTFGPIVVYYRLNPVTIRSVDKNSLKWNRLRGANTYRILLTKGSKFNGVYNENKPNTTCNNSSNGCLLNKKVGNDSAVYFNKTLEAGQKYCASIRAGTTKNSSTHLAHHSEWSTSCFTVPSEKKPDLTISSFSVSPQTLVEGESFTVRATVKNTGSATSNSTILAYYYSTDNRMGGDNRLDAASVGSLSPNGTDSDSSTHNSHTARTLYVYACVESVSNESNTNNNCSSMQQVVTKVKPVEKKPDLTISSFSVSPQTLIEGESFTVRATVKNTGNATSNSTILAYYYSTDNRMGGDNRLDTSSIRSLSPNGTDSDSSTHLSHIARTLYVYACVEPVSNESNTSNNCSSMQQVVTKVKPVEKKPDLTISSFSVSPQTLIAGESFTVYTTVKNTGNATSNSTILAYYYSTDNKMGGDNRLDISSIGSLSPNGTDNDSSTHLSPIARTLYVYACIESVSNESNTDNNCSSLQQVVTKPVEKKEATISYTNPVTFDLVEVGKPTVKTIDITNTGNAPLTSFVMNSLTNVKADVPRECATLAAGAKCSITLTFTPSEVKNEVLTLPFTSSATNNGGQHSISLNTNVKKTPAKLTLTPDELDFSNLEIGKKSLKQIFTLSNKGMETLSLETPTASPEGFELVPVDCTLPLVLPENKSCQVEVVFAPSEVKTYDTTLPIKPTNTTVQGQVLTLKGTGTPKPTVSLKVIISEANSGLITTDPSGTMVCANDICQGHYTVNEKVTITARPNPGFGFTKWSGNCEGAQVETEITLDTAKNCTANFTQLAANLSLDPITPQDFGDVKVNETSEPKVFTLTNDGDADATITSYKTAKPEFVVEDVNQCLTKPITKNGGTCQLEVTFKPTKGEPIRDYLIIDSSTGKLPSVELNGFGKVIEQIFRLIAVIPPNADLSPGSTFQVTFKFMADDDVNADGVAMSAYYDINKLEALKITNKNTFDMEIYSEIIAEKGRIDFMVMNSETGLAPKEPFDLFTVDFKVKEDVKPNDTTEITFSEDNVYIDEDEYIAMTSEPIKLTFKGILDKDKLDFGKVITTAIAPKTLEITIKNARNSALLIDKLYFAPAETALSIEESCGEQVAAKSECTLQVKFKPDAVRNYSTELKVDYHYADTTVQTASAAMLGEGVAPAQIKVEFDWYKHVDSTHADWKVPLTYWVGGKEYTLNDAPIMTGETEVNDTGVFYLPSELLTEDKDHCLVIKAGNSFSISHQFNPTTSNTITIPSDVNPLIVNGFSNVPNSSSLHNQLGFLSIFQNSRFLSNQLKAFNKEKILATDTGEYDAIYDLNADGEIYIYSQKEADNFTDTGDIAWLQSIFRTQFEKRGLNLKRGVLFGSQGCLATPPSANTLPTSRRDGVGKASLFTNPVKEQPVGSVQQVDVQLKTKTPAHFFGANVVLTFDPQQVEVTNLKVHPHFESPTLYKIYPDKGIILGMLHTFRFSDETTFTEMNIMSFDIKTLVEGGEKTLQFHQGSEQMVAIGEGSSDDIIIVRDAEVLFNTIDVIDEAGEIPTCPIYGIQDNGLNNTQLFVIDPVQNKVSYVGGEHKGVDIEGIAIHPDTDQLYGSSGDNTQQKGHLYYFDKETGAVTSIGATGFKEVDGIAFHPSGELWGFAIGEGLIIINPETAESELMIPFKGEIEDITFSRDGMKLYAAQDSAIWGFDGKVSSIVCSNLPKQIEALHSATNNALLFSFHGDKRGYINVLNIDTCEIVVEKGMPTPLNDIEGLALLPSCLTNAP